MYKFKVWRIHKLFAIFIYIFFGICIKACTCY